MIIDSLRQVHLYAALNPRFPAAFEFLRSASLPLLPEGRYEVEGSDLVAIVVRAEGKTRAGAKLEAHRKYIDIQYVVAGKEEMGWAPLSGCAAVTDPYDEEKDILFFGDQPAPWVVVPPGSFALFFPEDAHAPLVSEGAVHKVIMKVRTADDRV